MKTFNLHPLFSSSNADSYEQHISLLPDDRAALLSARTAIRAHIRSELALRIAAARVDGVGEIVPKFITQGSYAYGLINLPAQPPRQQADLDDGVYVPLSFCESTGTPRAASRLLLDILEALLTDLAERRRWTIDNGNPNCTRVIIAHDKHVDVPLYSIPDDEFRKIAQARFQFDRNGRAFPDFYLSDALDDTWEAMPERVRLAHRLRGWVDSDPRPIRDWIEQQVRLKSEQLRRLIRYLKAWRDVQQWTAGDPKSILLMALADATLDRKIDGRDDLALIQVCSRIPDCLRAPVTIPAIPGEDLSKSLDEDGIRDTLIARVIELQATLSACVNGKYTPADTCKLLRQAFGRRFPDRPDRIRIEEPEATVRAVSPRHIASAPIVGRRQAG